MVDKFLGLIYTGIKDIKERVEVMFTNIGKKIKALAKILALIGIVICCIGGLIMIVAGIAIGSDEGVIFAVAGLGTAALGSLFSWISSFILYGFGELVDNSAIIAGKNQAGSYGNVYRPAPATQQNTVLEQPVVEKPAEDPRRKALDKMRREGLITEEEYNEKTAQL